MEVSIQETLAAQQTHRLLATNSYNYLFVETLKKPRSRQDRAWKEKGLLWQVEL